MSCKTICYYMEIAMQVPTFAPSLYTADSPCNAIIVHMGMAVFERLQASLGGRDVKVPMPGRMSDDHPLVAALGREDALRLAELMTGEQFYIPRGHVEPPRLNAVIAEVQAGTRTQDIAVKVGISERQVRRLKQRARELEERQSKAPAHSIAAE